MRLSVALVFCSVSAAAFGQAAESKQLWAKSYLDQPAPKLQVAKWLTAVPDTKGKFVLLDFWATWCPPCREAISELNAIKQQFGDRVVVIGLSDEDEATIENFQAYAKARNPDLVINYAIAIDPQKRTKNEVQVTGIPHLMLIDPAGVVRWEGFPFLKGYEFSPQVVQQALQAQKAGG
jgi:cytochrome c biogenesis protein CcmG, thiol:disulfide interchange protein DsbE